MALEVTINKAATSEAETAGSSFLSQASFGQKIISVQFTLATLFPNNTQPTTFAGTPGSNSVTLTGHRTRCRIRNAGTPSGSFLDMAIYGLSPDLMNQLTSLGNSGQNTVSRNSVVVSAGQAIGNNALALVASSLGLGSSSLSIVFGGIVWFSYGDYNQMPEVPLIVQAQGGLYAAVKSTAPASFQGSASIVSIMQGFAQALGLAFENNGVSGSLQNPYFRGTLIEQVYEAAEAAGCIAQIVDGGTKLAIWPIGGSRTSQAIPLVSAATGMIASPKLQPNGWCVVETVFNPRIVFGGNIQIFSLNVPQANKTWTVYHMDLALDSLAPRGEWKQILLCSPKETLPNTPPTVQQ